MASTQEAGTIRLYRSEPNGNKTLILRQRVEQLAPAGGAPDSAPASVATPEKLLTVNSPVLLKNDDILLVSFTADGADGIDVSDMIWSVPMVTNTGSNALSAGDFANPALADYTTVPGQESFIAGYKVVEGSARIAGKIFIDVQDDTA